MKDYEDDDNSGGTGLPTYIYDFITKEVCISISNNNNNNNINNNNINNKE